MQSGDHSCRCPLNVIALCAVSAVLTCQAIAQSQPESVPVPQPQAIAPPVVDYGVQYQQAGPDTGPSDGPPGYYAGTYNGANEEPEQRAVSRLFRNYPIDFDPNEASLWPRPAICGREMSLHLSELSETWLAASNHQMGMATTHIEFEMALAGPDMLLSVSPSFQMHVLDGPSGPDVPSRLYDIDIETTFTWRVNERWSWEFTVMPLVQSDFESSQNRVRVFGSVIGRYELTPVSNLVFGVMASPYRGQSLIGVLGFQWTPNDRWQVDFVLPEPKVAWRLPDFLLPRTWLYARSQLYGGAWNIERASGRADILEYDDQRFMVGLEGMFANGGRWFLEGGIAYDRYIHYQSWRGSRKLDSAAMLQGGLRF